MAEKLSHDLIGQLLGLLAHDLRNPLSALHSNVGFIGSMIDESNEDAQEALADAMLSCEGLAHIIDSVELLARVLTRTTGFVPAPFALAPMIQDVSSGAMSLAKSHEVTLSVDPVSATTESRVDANREMSERALNALLRNCIQHAPARSVVRLSVEVEPNWCNLIVRDDGTPLAEDVVKSAFTASGQLSTKSMRGGRYSRGLGLYCAKICATAGKARVTFHQDGQPGNAFKLALKRHKKSTRRQPPVT